MGPHVDLWGFFGGQGLWEHCTIYLLLLWTLKHICLLSFPLPWAFPFPQLPSPFLRLKYPRIPPPSSGLGDISLLLLPGDGGLMGADRAPVCAQPLKRTVGMSKHFTGGAKP